MIHFLYCICEPVQFGHSISKVILRQFYFLDVNFCLACMKTADECLSRSEHCHSFFSAGWQVLTQALLSPGNLLPENAMMSLVLSLAKQTDKNEDFFKTNLCSFMLPIHLLQFIFKRTTMVEKTGKMCWVIVPKMPRWRRKLDSTWCEQIKSKQNKRLIGVRIIADVWMWFCYHLAPALTWQPWDKEASTYLLLLGRYNNVTGQTCQLLWCGFHGV